MDKVLKIITVITGGIAVVVVLFYSYVFFVPHHNTKDLFYYLDTPYARSSVLYQHAGTAGDDAVSYVKIDTAAAERVTAKSEGVFDPCRPNGYCTPFWVQHSDTGTDERNLMERNNSTDDLYAKTITSATLCQYRVETWKAVNITSSDEFVEFMKVKNEAGYSYLSDMICVNRDNGYAMLMKLRL